jgi:hypothetical protein
MDQKKFQNRVIGLLIVIVFLQVVIISKQYQIETHIIETLRGLYYDLVEVVK